MGDSVQQDISSSGDSELSPSYHQPPIMEVENLKVGYGNREIVNGIAFKTYSGTITVIIGHNGAGKSTLLKALFGLLKPWEGKVFYDGKVVFGSAPRELMRQGLAYIPQGKNVFEELTVEQNLRVSEVVVSNRNTLKQEIDRILTLFPQLVSRLRQPAYSLSGGERQMVALASALILQPRLILMDEPSLGLDTERTLLIFDYVKKISQDTGIGVILVEQKVREALRIADQILVLRQGLLSFRGTENELQKDELSLSKIYFQ